MQGGTAGRDRLGEALLIGLPALALALLMARPLGDVDLFWQLRLGEIMLDTGHRVAREPFAALHLGEPLAPLAWAAQPVMALARRLGGWRGLQLGDALVWLGGFIMPALACRRRGDRARWVGIAFALGVAGSFVAASVRPQSFAVLAFGLLVALLARPPRRAVALALGAALCLIWQNLHPSVAVAGLYCGARAGWGWAACWRRAAAPPWLETGLALIALAAMFATPLGLAIVAVSRQNAAAAFAAQVTEWLPVWSPVNRGFLPILLPLPAVTLRLIAARRGRADPQALAGALALLALGCVSIRFLLFWTIAALPVVAALGGRTAARPRLAAPGAALAIVAALALLQPPRFEPGLALPAIAALRASGAKGTVFAEAPWGGPLIDAGWPRWTVAFDGRYYAYPLAEQDSGRAALAGRVPLSMIDARYHPGAFLLSPRAGAALIAALRADATHWREVYADRVAVAVVRREGFAAPPR